MFIEKIGCKNNIHAFLQQREGKSGICKLLQFVAGLIGGLGTGFGIQYIDTPDQRSQPGGNFISSLANHCDKIAGQQVCFCQNFLPGCFRKCFRLAWRGWMLVRHMVSFPIANNKLGLKNLQGGSGSTGAASFQFVLSASGCLIHPDSNRWLDRPLLQ